MMVFPILNDIDRKNFALYPTVLILLKISHMITRHVKNLALAGLLLAVCLPKGFANRAFLQQSSTEELPNPVSQSIFDQLSGQDILELTITTNLVDLIDNRRTVEYQKAELTYEDQKGMSITHGIKVKPRGKFRRRVCEFPPIKIKFSKKDLSAEGLEKEFNTLKLVTHCLDDKAASKDNVMKEFLAYQLYSQLTDNSYRTQLVKITYVDGSGKLGKIRRYGFLIENTDEMATRLSGSECECMNPEEGSVSSKDENLMALFQYMIGNEDWSTMLNRNIKLVKPSTDQQMITVPYDFDFAGIVDASYALPNADLGLLTVKDRAFMGQEASDELFRANLKLFEDKRLELTEYIMNFQHLSKANRLETIQYLDSFYEKLEQMSVKKASNIYGVFTKGVPVNTVKQSNPTKRTVGK